MVATVLVPNSVLGHTYQGQYTEDLNTAWTVVGSPLDGNGGEPTQACPAQPAAPRAFYRVLILR